MDGSTLISGESMAPCIEYGLGRIPKCTLLLNPSFLRFFILSSLFNG